MVQEVHVVNDGFQRQIPVSGPITKEQLRELLLSDVVKGKQTVQAQGDTESARQLKEITKLLKDILGEDIGETGKDLGKALDKSTSVIEEQTKETKKQRTEETKSFKDLNGSLKALSQQATSAGEGLEDATTSLSGKMAKAAEHIIDASGNVSRGFAKSYAQFKIEFAGVTDGFKKGLTATLRWIDKTAFGLFSGLAKLPGLISFYAKAAWGGTKFYAKAAWEGTKFYAKAAWGGTMSYAKAAWEGTKFYAKAAWEGTKSYAKIAWDYTGGVVVSFLNKWLLSPLAKFSGAVKNIAVSWGGYAKDVAIKWGGIAGKVMSSVSSKVLWPFKMAAKGIGAVSKWTLRKISNAGEAAGRVSEGAIEGLSKGAKDLSKIPGVFRDTAKALGAAAKPVEDVAVGKEQIKGAEPGQVKVTLPTPQQQMAVQPGSICQCVAQAVNGLKRIIIGQARGAKAGGGVAATVSKDDIKDLVMSMHRSTAMNEKYQEILRKRGIKEEKPGGEGAGIQGPGGGFGKWRRMSLYRIAAAGAQLAAGQNSVTEFISTMQYEFAQIPALIFDVFWGIGSKLVKIISWPFAKIAKNFGARFEKGTNKAIGSYARMQRRFLLGVEKALSKGSYKAWASIVRFANKRFDRLFKSMQRGVSAIGSLFGKMFGVFGNLLSAIGVRAGALIEQLSLLFIRPLIQEVKYFQELRETAFQTEGIGKGRGTEVAPPAFYENILTVGYKAAAALRGEEAVKPTKTDVTAAGRMADVFVGKDATVVVNKMAIKMREIEETGQSMSTNQKTQLKLWRRGIRINKNLNKVTAIGLNLARMTSANAESTSEFFADMHQSLRLDTIQLAEVGRGMRMIARETGITGDNLVKVAQESKKFMQNMKQAGTYTSVSGKNMMRLMAEASKTGTSEGMQAVLGVLSGSTLAGEGAAGPKQLIMEATGGRQDLVQKVLAGTVTTDKGAMRDIAAGMEGVLKRFTRGRRVEDLDPQTRGMISGIMKRLYGVQLEELQAIIGNFNNASKTFAQRMDDLSKVANQGAREEQKRLLEESQRMEYLSLFNKALQTEEGKFGPAIERFRKMAGKDLPGTLKAMDTEFDKGGKFMDKMLRKSVLDVKAQLEDVGIAGKKGISIDLAALMAGVGKEGEKISPEKRQAALELLGKLQRTANAKQIALTNPVSRIEEGVMKIEALLRLQAADFLMNLSPVMQAAMDKMEEADWYKSLQKGEPLSKVMPKLQEWLKKDLKGEFKKIGDTFGILGKKKLIDPKTAEMGQFAAKMGEGVAGLISWAVTFGEEVGRLGLRVGIVIKDITLKIIELEKQTGILEGMLGALIWTVEAVIWMVEEVAWAFDQLPDSVQSVIAKIAIGVSLLWALGLLGPAIAVAKFGIMGLATVIGALGPLGLLAAGGALIVGGEYVAWRSYFEGEADKMRDHADKMETKIGELKDKQENIANLSRQELREIIKRRDTVAEQFTAIGQTKQYYEKEREKLLFKAGEFIGLYGSMADATGTALDKNIEMLKADKGLIKSAMGELARRDPMDAQRMIKNLNTTYKAVQTENDRLDKLKIKSQHANRRAEFIQRQEQLRGHLRFLEGLRGELIEKAKLGRAEAFIEIHGKLVPKEFHGVLADVSSKMFDLKTATDPEKIKALQSALADHQRTLNRVSQGAIDITSMFAGLEKSLDLRNKLNKVEDQAIEAQEKAIESTKDMAKSFKALDRFILDFLAVKVGLERGAPAEDITTRVSLMKPQEASELMSNLAKEFPNWNRSVNIAAGKTSLLAVEFDDLQHHVAILNETLKLQQRISKLQPEEAKRAAAGMRELGEVLDTIRLNVGTQKQQVTIGGMGRYWEAKRMELLSETWEEATKKGTKNLEAALSQTDIAQKALGIKDTAERQKFIVSEIRKLHIAISRAQDPSDLQADPKQIPKFFRQLITLEKVIKPLTERQAEKESLERVGGPKMLTAASGKFMRGREALPLMMAHLRKTSDIQADAATVALLSAKTAEQRDAYLAAQLNKAVEVYHRKGSTWEEAEQAARALTALLLAAEQLKAKEAKTQTVTIPKKAAGTSRVTMGGLIEAHTGEAILTPGLAERLFSYKDAGPIGAPDVPTITTAMQYLANSIMGLTAEAVPGRGPKAETAPMKGGDIEDEIKRREAEAKQQKTELVSPELDNVDKNTHESARTLHAVARLLSDIRGLLASRSRRRRRGTSDDPGEFEADDPYMDDNLHTEWPNGRYGRMAGIEFDIADM